MFVPSAANTLPDLQHHQQHQKHSSSASNPIFGSIPTGSWVRSGEDDSAPLHEFVDIISGKKKTNNNASETSTNTAGGSIILQSASTLLPQHSFAPVNLMGGSIMLAGKKSFIDGSFNPAGNTLPTQNESNNTTSERDLSESRKTNNDANNSNPSLSINNNQLNHSFQESTSIHPNNLQASMALLLQTEDDDALSPEELKAKRKLQQRNRNEKLLMGVDDLVAQHHLYSRRPGLRNVQDQQPGFYVRAKFPLARDNHQLRPPTPLYIVMQKLMKNKLSTFASVIYAVWFVTKIRQLLMKTEVQERILGRLKEGEVQKAAKARVLAKKFYGASTRSMTLHVMKQRQNMKEILKDGIQQSQRRLFVTKYDRKATDIHDDGESDDESGTAHEDDDEEDHGNYHQFDHETQHHHSHRHHHANSSAFHQTSSMMKRRKNDPLNKSELFHIRVKPKEDTLFDRSKYDKNVSQELPMYLRRTSFVNMIDPLIAKPESSRRASTSTTVTNNAKNEKDNNEKQQQQQQQQQTQLGEVLFADKDKQQQNSPTATTKSNAVSGKKKSFTTASEVTGRNPFNSQEFKKREGQSRMRRQSLASRTSSMASTDHQLLPEILKEKSPQENDDEGENEESEEKPTAETKNEEKPMSFSFMRPEPLSLPGNSDEQKEKTNTNTTSTASNQLLEPLTSPKLQHSLMIKADLDKLPMTQNIFLWHFCWKDEQFEPPHPSLPSLATTAANLGITTSSASSPTTENNNGSPTTNNVTASLRERDATKYVTQVKGSELAIFASHKGGGPDLFQDLMSLQNCFASNNGTTFPGSMMSPGGGGGMNKQGDEAQSMLKRSLNLGRSINTNTNNNHQNSPSSTTVTFGNNNNDNNNDDHQQQQHHVYHQNTPRKPAVPALGKKRKSSARKQAIIASKSSATFEPFALHFGMEHSTFVRRSMNELTRQIESHRDIYEQKRELLMNKENYNRRYQAHIQNVDNSVRKRLTDQCDDEIKQYCMDWFTRLKDKVSSTMSGGLNPEMKKVFDAFEPVFKTGILTPQIFEKTAVLKLYGRHLLERTSKKRASTSKVGQQQQQPLGTMTMINSATSASGASSSSPVQKTLSSSTSMMNNINKKKRGAAYFNNSSTSVKTSGGHDEKTSSASISPANAALPSTQQQQRTHSNVSPLAPTPPPPPAKTISGSSSGLHHHHFRNNSMNNNNSNDSALVSPAAAGHTLTILAEPTVSPPLPQSIVEIKQQPSPTTNSTSNNNRNSNVSNNKQTPSSTPAGRSLIMMAASTSSEPHHLQFASSTTTTTTNNNNNNTIINNQSTDPFTIPVFDGLLVAPTNEECVLVDLGAQFVLMRLRIPFDVSQEKAKEIITRSGANYSLMEASDVDQIYRHESRVGKARVQRIGKLDEVIDRNNRIERMVEEGRKLAEKRIAERRHLRNIVFEQQASSSSHNASSIISGKSNPPTSRSSSSNNNNTNSKMTNNNNNGGASTARVTLPPINSNKKGRNASSSTSPIQMMNVERSSLTARK